MACILLNNGLESSLHKQLIEKYGQEVADKKMQNYMSENFKNKFGDYQFLIDNPSDLIPSEFKNRINEKFEPMLFEDNVGLYYLDKNFKIQYVDTTESELYNVFKSERAINSLVEILSTEHLNNIGFTMDFDSLGIKEASSSIKLKDSIINKIKNLSFELINSDDLDIQTNAMLLNSLLDNKAALDQIEYKINELYKSRKFEYSEEIENEQVDDVHLGQRDQIVSKPSFAINPKSKLGALIKLRLSLIKDPTNIEPDFGQAKSIDFNVLYNKLTNILSDNYPDIDKSSEKWVVSDMFNSIIDTLKIHSPNIKYLSNLVDYLNKLNIEVKDINSIEGIQLQQLKAGIVRAFNLQKNNFATKTLTENKVVVEKGKTRERVAANGVIVIENETNDLIGSEYSYETQDAKTLINTKKSYLVNWGLSLKQYFNFPTSVSEPLDVNKIKQLNELISKIDLLEKNTKFTPLEKSQNVLKLLKTLGINISEEVFNLAINQNKETVLSEVSINQNYNGFIDSTKKTLSGLIDNFQNNREIFNTYWFKQIAEAEVFYSESGSDSSINTGGKQKYLFSNPSSIKKTIYSWKKNPKSLERFYNGLNSWEKKSKLFIHLLALDKPAGSIRDRFKVERLAKLDLDLFNNFTSVSNKNIDGRNRVVREKAKDIQELSKNEDIKNFVNDILHSQIDNNSLTHGRGTTAPGKSTQVEIVHDLFFDQNVTYRQDGSMNLSNSVDLMYDYFVGEVDRMEEAYNFISNKKNESKTKTHYHFKEKKSLFDENGNIIPENLGNAFKSQLLPDLNFDKIKNNINYVDKTKPLYTEEGIVIKENLDFNKKEIKDLIEKSLIQKIEYLKKDLLNADLFEKTGEDTYINKGVDTRIMKKYSSNYKINNESLNKLLGDVLINGLVNHIEYSKVISGDVAYYKNPVDYIKRVGADLSDGIYEYLNDSNSSFNVGVIDSVEFVEPYLKEFKELIESDPSLLNSWEKQVNAADAQAWITPKRWKSILLGCAMFTEKHQSVYLKLIDKNKDPLTNEELKLVAQPLKGVYKAREENGAPVFLKYSQAVLIPQLLKDNKLNDLHEFMKHHKIDELLTFDAIKVGSPRSTKIHNELGDLIVRNEDGSFKELNTLRLDSRGWKLQQDLPIKTYKETDAGSQLLNNMLILLADKVNSGEKQFEHNGTEYTTIEYAKLIDNTLGSLLGIGLNDFFSEFDINKETNEIENSAKFYNLLADELNSREYSDEVIKALRARLSIVALPGFDSKLQSIFSSIVKDRTVKIKTNGGSMIQMASYGLTKEEADSKHNGIKWSPSVGMYYTEGSWKWEKGHHVKPYTYLLDGTGNPKLNIFGKKIIKPEQIMISGSFIAKYIPDYESKSSEELFGKFNEETGQLEGGLIDNKILENIIGYRIPNQGPSSNAAMQVVAILPPGNGDTIVAFAGVTMKTGSDFDIDKMYIMFPNYKSRYSDVNKNISNAEKFIKDNDISKEDMLKDFEDENISVSATIDFKTLKSNYISQILFEQTKSFYSDEFRSKNELNKVVGIDYIDSDKNSKESLQNKLIELYKGLILHNTNIQKIMTPLDFPHIKDDALNISPTVSKGNFDVFEAIQDIRTKYSFLDGLLGVGMEANATNEYARGSMSDVYYEAVNIGGRSNKGEVLNVINKFGDNEDIEHTKFDQIKSQELSDKELKQYLESYNSRAEEGSKLTAEMVMSYKDFNISDNLSALMNAFVDIAKDPYITNVNWNSTTTSIGNMLIRGGVHPFIVMSFIAQPIISEYVDFNKQYNTLDKSKQTSNTKDAFKIFKVGELIKEDTFILTTLSSGENIEMGYNQLYKIVAAGNNSLDNLSVKDFGTKKVILKIERELGLKKISQEDVQRIFDVSDKIIKKHKIYFDKYYSNVLDNEIGVLRDNIFENNNNFQANVFNNFLGFANDSKKLKASMEASSHDINGYGKNTTSLLINLNKIQNVSLKGVINYESKNNHVDGTLKLLGHRQNNMMKVKEVIQSNPTSFPSATPYIWNTFNKISQDIYGSNLENEDLADNLDKIFKTYLMSSFDPLNNSLDENNKILESLPEEFINFKNNKSNFERYPILKELRIIEDKGKKFIGLDNKQNSKEYTDKMINSWRELIQYNEKFGEDLIRYSFLTSGFNNSTVSFHQYIPPSFFFKYDFNSHVDSFTKKYSENEVDDNFINHFYLSNLDNAQIVKNVQSFAQLEIKKQEYPVTKEVVSFSKSVSGRFIKVNYTTQEGDPYSVFHKSLGINKKGDNIYTRYIPVKKGYSLIKPIISQKQVGISEYSYNADFVSIAPEILNASSLEILDNVYLDNYTEQEKSIDEQEDVVNKENLTQFTEPRPEVKEEVKSEIIGKTSIQMQPQNVEKILNGTKTTTIRESIPKGGNIAVGETKVVNFGGKDFYVTNRGNLTIQEAGGLENMLKSEGLNSIDDFMYNQSKNWAKGNGKMYVFDIKESFENISNKPQQLSLFDNIKASKTMSILEDMFNQNLMINKFNALNVNNIEDLKNLSEDQLGELLKKICK